MKTSDQKQTKGLDTESGVQQVLAKPLPLSRSLEPKWLRSLSSSPSSQMSLSLSVCNVLVCCVMLVILCCCTVPYGWAVPVVVVVSCCAVCARFVPLLVFSLLCSCTENNAVCTFFDGTPGTVLKIHNGASRAVSLSVSLCTHVSVSRRLSVYPSLPLLLSFLSISICFVSRRSLFIYLSLFGSLFLFSKTMTLSTRPVGSLCTHGSDLP